MRARALLGVVCLFVGHRWTSPALRLGKAIPESMRPPPNASLEQVRAAFRAYSRLSCSRCGTGHPLMS